MSEPKPDGKPFAISKRLVWEAWRRVKANRGAAGVDEESILAFEANLKANLYKVWNRMSSGSYVPPPVRAVEIPKKSGGSRMLGVPTVADRVAQTVAYLYLEPEVEPVFHGDSYGYRPGRSAHDALGTCRQRCWRYDWVLDLDLKSFFDSLDHSLVLKRGGSPHEPAVDPPLRGAVAESAAATGGRHPQATGSRESAGLGDLARAGEHLSARVSSKEK